MILDKTVSGLTKAFANQPSDLPEMRTQNASVRDVPRNAFTTIQKDDARKLQYYTMFMQDEFTSQTHALVAFMEKRFADQDARLAAILEALEEDS